MGLLALTISETPARTAKSSPPIER
jgi:hypothetical protein